MPRKGFAPLKLAVLASRHKDVLPHFRRFLQTRNEAPEPPAAVRWLKQRVPALILITLLAFTAVIVLSACGEGPDPSGLNTGSQSNLTSVSANGTPLKQEELDKAKQSEPFAYNLALLVDQNRLGVNFVWTLVTGYLVMFMQAGFALVETGLCRAKNAGHTMAMNFMIYGIGMIGYFIAGFAFQFGGIGLIGVPNLGGLAALKNELAIPIGGTNWGIIGFK
ncbi:MAG: ammonium transporter, partial [Ktedonobacteraceae bacterium]|nr:ammonium transporter [Ktedonobacteraceae bacterium]